MAILSSHAYYRKGKTLQTKAKTSSNGYGRVL